MNALPYDNPVMITQTQQFLLQNTKWKKKYKFTMIIEREISGQNNSKAVSDSEQ